MKSYTPPTVDPFASILGDSDSANMTDASNEEDLSSIYHRWGGLHQNTRQNLLRFEDPEFQLPTRADGDVAVRNLVSGLHTVLCWLLISTKYSSVRLTTLSGFVFVSALALPWVMSIGPSSQSNSTRCATELLREFSKYV